MSATRKPQRRTLNITEVAAMLGVARSTLYLELSDKGHVLGVRPITVRSRKLFSRALIEEALKSGPREGSAA